MRSENNISKLLVITLLWLTACAHKYTIPDVNFYAEIPFIDCPEGVYVNMLTGKRGTISCEDWRKIRPTMIMLDPVGKGAAFNGWTDGCRYAGKKCEQQMKSVKDAVDKLDAITSKILKATQ